MQLQTASQLSHRIDPPCTIFTQATAQHHIHFFWARLHSYCLQAILVLPLSYVRDTGMSVLVVK